MLLNIVNYVEGIKPLIGGLLIIIKPLLQAQFGTKITSYKQLNLPDSYQKFKKQSYLKKLSH